MRAPILPQGSLGWLVAHELRLGLRNSRTKGAARWIGMAMLAGYVALGCMIGWGLSGTPIPYRPVAGDIALALAIGVFSFMVTQAMLGSQATLYGQGDLDLLLSAPIRERTVLTAKLIGIAATILLTYALLLLPILLPVAILGHPRLLGVVALLVSLALIASCLGLALTLLIARTVGPRAARTAGQVAAAMIGGAVFIVTQLWAHSDRLGGRMALIDALRKARAGELGPGAIPGKVAFGDPLATLLALGGAILLFVATGAAFRRWFLAGFQTAGMRLGPVTHASGSVAGHFRKSLFGAVFAKEWQLLRRDPALLFQVVLRLIYLAPLALAGIGGRHPVPIAPGLAFASVLVVGQLVASFAWLTISAEDAPDLIAVAPVEKEQVEMAKLLAALGMAAPLGLVLPAVEAAWTVPGALVTIFLTAVAGALAGLIELKMGKPMPRVSFNRRRAGNAVAGILSGIATLLISALAGLTVYALG